MYGLFEPVRGSLFLYFFFTVITLGLRQFHSALATRKISFRFLLGCHFRKKKKRKNPEKETGSSADCCHWETKGNRINTGVKPKNNREKVREWTDARDRKDDLKTRLKRKRLSLLRIYMRKEKEEEKKKRCAGKGKEKGQKRRSGLADGGRPEGK